MEDISGGCAAGGRRGMRDSRSRRPTAGAGKRSMRQWSVPADCGRGQARARGESIMNPVNEMRPIHPGEVLREEFLVPLGMSAHVLALGLEAPAPRINDIGGSGAPLPQIRHSEWPAISAALRNSG